MAVVEVSCLGRVGEREHTRVISVPDDVIAWRIVCLECGGSGWWDYAPYAVEGAPCVDCKGTGRVWVGLL